MEKFVYLKSCMYLQSLFSHAWKALFGVRIYRIMFNQDAASTNDSVHYCLMFKCIVNSMLVKYTFNIFEF